MGISVLNLSTGEAPAEFEWNGQVVHLTWDPNAYTPEAEATWQSLEKEGYVGPLLTNVIPKLVKSWDVRGDVDPITGKLIEADYTFPLETEKLQLLPVTFLGAILRCINEESRPKEARNGNSADG